MTVSLTRKLCSALFPAALGLFSSVAGAQTPPDADQGAAPAADSEEEYLPAYHHSLFSWEHTVTSQTLGVGDTPQSSNPTYTMGFVAKTRYYFLDDTPGGKHFSVRLDGGLYREFTNSDVTAKRGEWTFSDTDVAARRETPVGRGDVGAGGHAAEARHVTEAAFGEAVR